MTTFQTPISDPPISAILVKNKPMETNVTTTAAKEANGSITGSQEFTISPPHYCATLDIYFVEQG